MPRLPWWAAVALVLRPGTGGLEALFIKRAEHPDDPWSGHVGLPGGRAEDSDPGLVHTAVRETEEEIGLRLLLVTTVFFVVSVAFGAIARPEAVLAIPAALLTGLAFAAPIVAFSATQKDTNGFNSLFRFGIIPLFLFSGTFFPITTRVSKTV